jgi:hypothetical protein
MIRTCRAHGAISLITAAHAKGHPERGSNDKKYSLAGFVAALIATASAGAQALQENPNTVVVDWNKSPLVSKITRL